VDTAAPSLDWLISVDDHIIEPPNVWQDRLPAKLREAGPRFLTIDGVEHWVYDGKTIPTSGLSAAAGRRKEEFSPLPIQFSEMRPGCYDPVARLADMDQAGILASLCFPSFPRFCGQLFLESKDKELALKCVEAYNDWLIEEWCGAAPGRYIPMIITPLWDPRLAAKEIERCAAKGARAVAFSENPAPLGLPTIFDPSRHWDPLFEAAADAELVICMHVGSSSQLPAISPETPAIVNLAWGAVRTAGTMLEWLFSGYFKRMPGLKIALSEGNIGWIPYFLERAEQVLENQRHWAARGIALDGYEASVANNFTPDDLADVNLRQLFRDHVYGCFIDDIHGLNNLDVIGVDNVMIETDYPHTDSTWPNCISLAHKRLAHLPADVQYKVLRGNAERLYRFQPVEPVR